MKDFFENIKGCEVIEYREAYTEKGQRKHPILQLLNFIFWLASAYCFLKGLWALANVASHNTLLTFPIIADFFGIPSYELKESEYTFWSAGLYIVLAFVADYISGKCEGTPSKEYPEFCKIRFASEVSTVDMLKITQEFDLQQEKTSDVWNVTAKKGRVAG